jgi:hypothetical protein
MPPIHISDRETDTLVRRLAERRSLGLTEAIKLAISNELSKDKIEDAPPATEESQGRDTDKAALERELDALMRSSTLEYTRLLAKRRGTSGVGSRVYQMLARHGAVETLRRLINRPTDGLKFLKSIDKLYLSAEEIVLNPRYTRIITEDMRARARANLSEIN